MILPQTVLAKFHLKLSGAAVSTVFFRDNVRQEIVRDFMSGVAVEYFDVDVRVKFSDSRWNRSRYIQVAHFVIDDEQRRTAVA